MRLCSRRFRRRRLSLQPPPHGEINDLPDYSPKYQHENIPEGTSANRRNLFEAVVRAHKLHAAVAKNDKSDQPKENDVRQYEPTRVQVSEQKQNTPCCHYSQRKSEQFRKAQDGILDDEPSRVKNSFQLVVHCPSP